MQASSTSGTSSKTPSAVVSPSDTGTDTAKADYSSNEGSSLGAGAASSSSPRTTLAGGAVFAGEPMPISDTQFLAPRVCSRLQQPPILVSLCISLCVSLARMQHVMHELHMYQLFINGLLT